MTMDEERLGGIGLRWLTHRTIWWTWCIRAARAGLAFCIGEGIREADAEWGEDMRPFLCFHLNFIER